MDRLFFVFVLIAFVLFAVAFGLGFRYGRSKATAKFNEQINKLETLLAHAGFRFDELPRRMKELDDPSGSWTGEQTDPRARRAPGSVRRFDELPQHGDEPETRDPIPALAAAGPRPPRLAVEHTPIAPVDEEADTDEHDRSS